MKRPPKGARRKMAIPKLDKRNNATTPHPVQVVAALERAILAERVARLEGNLRRAFPNPIQDLDALYLTLGAYGAGLPDDVRAALFAAFEPDFSRGVCDD